MKKTLYIFIAAILSLFTACSEEKSPLMLSDLQINPADISIVKGESCRLTLTFTPENITDKSVIWTSSNDAVATVSPEGEVVAVECGDVVISAVSSGIMAVCNVKVVNTPAESITLDRTEAVLYPQNTLKLSVTSKPSDADLSELEWTSSDESVATVDQNGNVMAVAPGTAEINAVLEEISASCNITVMAKAEVGDFFYSDGTWSSELDNTKTVVGVVFYAGNPAKDDKVLAKEHPQCVNGLAVALTESYSRFHPEFSTFSKESGYATVSEWGEANMPDYETLETGLSRGDVGNFMLGYSNTAVLSAFNAAPENARWKLESMDSLDVFRVSNPLPENTSGWYMPSLKELHILRDGENDYNIFYVQPTMSRKNLVNGILSEIQGTTLLGQGTDPEYWSSTTYYLGGRIGFVDFKVSYIPGGQSPDYSVNTNRFIFAF